MKLGGNGWDCGGGGGDDGGFDTKMMWLGQLAELNPKPIGQDRVLA
jgi:hypothetical protein